MEYQFILYNWDRDSKVATLTLNRPEKLNAESLAMKAEIVDAVKQVERNDDVKVLVLKGAGRAFSSGGDLSEVGFIYGWEAPKPGETVRRPAQRTRLIVDRNQMMQGYQAVFYCAKPTIAQVHGYALEAGCWLQLMCDITIAAEDAMLGFPGQRLAFAGAAFVQPLVAAVGLRRARNMLLTGARITGKEAERIGLVTEAVPADRLEEEVTKLARTIAQLPADALVLGKMYSHMAYDSMGLTSCFSQFPIGHTLGTNLRFEPDEHNFFRARRDKGTRIAFHERDARLADIDGTSP